MGPVESTARLEPRSPFGPAISEGATAISLSKDMASTEELN